VAFDAPADKKAKGQVGWLLRQLKECPDRLIIETYPKKSRKGIASSLRAAREDQQLLVDPSGKDASRFRLIARSEMGLGRKNGKRAGFVRSVSDAVESFYGDILQNLTAYQVRAPQLKQTTVVISDEPSLPTVELVEPTRSPDAQSKPDDGPTTTPSSESWETSL
jgi:hypothetical protein